MLRGPRLYQSCSTIEEEEEGEGEGGGEGEGEGGGEGGGGEEEGEGEEEEEEECLFRNVLRHVSKYLRHHHKVCFYVC